MAYTLAFTVTQGIDPQSFTVTDLSTGSDVNVVQRRITLTEADGTFLVPSGTSTSYIDFPFSSGSSITLSVLVIDYALGVTLQYLDTNGNVLYSLTQNYAFTDNDENVDYGLTQALVANQGLLQDTNYVMNRFTFRMLIDSANQAVTTGNDINASQFLLDLAQVYVNNQSNYF